VLGSLFLNIYLLIKVNTSQMNTQKMNLPFITPVRMFGTENRPTDNPVAARDEVFEFIIFRGQDIKDIRLCEPPAPQPPIPGTLPYDPAIVQVNYLYELI
jgi:hypothetical protein